MLVIAVVVVRVESRGVGLIAGLGHLSLQSTARQRGPAALRLSSPPNPKVTRCGRGNLDFAATDLAERRQRQARTNSPPGPRRGRAWRDTELASGRPDASGYSMRDRAFA